MLHIKKIKPMFTSIVTSAEKFSEDQYDGSLIVAKKGDMKTYQKVIAIGSMVRDINIGDTVMINVHNFAVKRYSKDSVHNDMDDNPTIKYIFNYVNIDNENGESQEYLLINDRDVLYVFEGEEKNDAIIGVNKKKTKLIV